MSLRSLREILEFAIDKEQEAKEFYEHAAAHASYEAAKGVFIAFADEEQKHKELLEGYLTGEQTLEDYEFKPVADIKRSDYLVEQKYAPDMTYPHMLRLAMKREERAVQLYSDLASRAQAPHLQRLLAMLRQEEATHKLKLETMYDDYMAAMGD